MLRVRLSFLLLALSGLSLCLGQVGNLSAAVTQLSPCVLTCLTSAIADSPCQLTNTTCFCTDAQLNNNLQACVVKSCPIKEVLVAQKAEATMCGAPYRNERQNLRVTNIVLGVVSAAFVIIRIVYKLGFSVSELGWDDYLIVLTLLVGVPGTIITDLHTLPNGMGRDIWTVPFDQITEFTRWFYVMENLYFADLTLIKLTMLAFFLRIFPARNVRRTIWFTIVFTSLWGAGTLLTGVFQCTPIRYNWLRWNGEHEGKCLDINALGWSNAAISIALDIWMLAIPLFQVFKLKMSWQKKFSVAIMFMVGTFITAMSIVRLHALIYFSKSRNPTWDEAGVSQWSTIELNVGIICTCMPTIRTILVHYFPRIFSSTTTAYASNYHAKYGSHVLSGKMTTNSSVVRSRRANSMMFNFGSNGAGGVEGTVDSNGITCRTSFEVLREGRESREEEEELVHMDELSNQGTTKIKSHGNSSVGSVGSSVESVIAPLPAHLQRGKSLAFRN